MAKVEGKKPDVAALQRERSIDMAAVEACKDYYGFDRYTCVGIIEKNYNLACSKSSTGNEDACLSEYLKIGQTLFGICQGKEGVEALNCINLSRFSVDEGEKKSFGEHVKDLAAKMKNPSSTIPQEPKPLSEDELKMEMAKQEICDTVTKDDRRLCRVYIIRGHQGNCENALPERKSSCLADFIEVKKAEEKACKAERGNHFTYHCSQKFKVGKGPRKKVAEHLKEVREKAAIPDLEARAVLEAKTWREEPPQVPAAPVAVATEPPPILVAPAAPPPISVSPDIEPPPILVAPAAPPPILVAPAAPPPISVSPAAAAPAPAPAPTPTPSQPVKDSEKSLPPLPRLRTPEEREAILAQAKGAACAGETFQGACESFIEDHYRETCSTAKPRQQDQCLDDYIALGKSIFSGACKGQHGMDMLSCVNNGQFSVNEGPKDSFAGHLARIRKNAKQTVAEQYYQKGMEAFRAKNWEEAIPEFWEAASQGNFSALLYLGQSYLKKPGEDTKDLLWARHYFTTFLEYNPTFKKAEELRKIINRINAVHEKRKEIYRGGLQAYKDQKWTEAVDQFSLVVKNDETNAAAHFYLGKSYLKKEGDDPEDLSQARAHLRRFLELKPDFKKAREVEAVIDRLEKTLKK